MTSAKPEKQHCVRVSDSLETRADSFVIVDSQTFLKTFKLLAQKIMRGDTNL